MGTIPAAYRQGADTCITMTSFRPVWDDGPGHLRLLLFHCGGAVFALRPAGGVLAIVDPGETDFVPQSGTRYLLHGVFTFGASSNTTFM